LFLCRVIGVFAATTSSGAGETIAASATTARIRRGFFAALVEDGLFLENETVELAKRFVELAVESGAALLRGCRASAGRCACGRRCFFAALSFRFAAGLCLFACALGLFS
jgi:hypothetical protein